ncbi:hypothetical protein [Aureibacillus halotolerans]|uniref:Uncharacterized protein n=1 Tax=Aureibacillus halotolerans TaxID=1508390 RepID=A0A4R6TZY0_9BACI|nr:hypothetical protein [Aureibacillus halotolerans]TDQ39211.1 hypothetical protein EV213_108163 [Aureibacillus halotolerans]
MTQKKYYGIWNSHKKKWQFNIIASTRFDAKGLLHSRIGFAGHDSRYEARELPTDHPVYTENESVLTQEKPKMYFGIWNAWKKEWQFNIVANSKTAAKRMLHKKIGHDAKKWRFEPRKLPKDHPVYKRESAVNE